LNGFLSSADTYLCSLRTYIFDTCDINHA